MAYSTYLVIVCYVVYYWSFCMCVRCMESCCIVSDIKISTCVVMNRSGVLLIRSTLCFAGVWDSVVVKALRY
jgi:hypothetical protein